MWLVSWSRYRTKTLSLFWNYYNLGLLENDFHDVCCSLNTGDNMIIVTLDAYQNASLKGDQNKLYVGAVTLEVIIHNFPHQNLSNVTYDWNFGDGTNFTSSHLQKVIHNFTTVKSCTIVVNLHGWIQGKLCKGKANKTLQFKGMFFFRNV